MIILIEKTRSECRIGTPFPPSTPAAAANSPLCQSLISTDLGGFVCLLDSPEFLIPAVISAEQRPGIRS